LESFTETRSTADATEPCGMSQMIESQGIDSIRMPGSSHGGSGNVRNPWDYEVLPNSEFVGQVRF
jgi:hypothetical protein